MKHREQVISLYDEALFYRSDPEDTLCHLSGIDDAEAYGSYLALLISRLGISSTICDIGCGTLSPLKVLKSVLPPESVLRCRRPVKIQTEKDITKEDVNQGGIIFSKSSFSSDCNIKKCLTSRECFKGAKPDEINTNIPSVDQHNKEEPLISTNTEESSCYCFKGQNPISQDSQDDIIKQLRYTALDINPNMIKKAKERWKDYPNISFGIYDLEDCNLQDNYDIILLQESLAYFEEEDINDLIDYYYTKTNKVISLSLLDGTLPWRVQDELLISQRHPMTTLSYVLANYQFSSVDRALHPNRYRIDIYKEQKYYDLVKGIERGHYIWQE